MVEGLRICLTVRDDADDHLTRSVSPWSLVENDISAGAARSREISSSLSDTEFIGNGTDRASRPSALEDIVSSEYILRAMPEGNQATTQSDSILGASVEPSLPLFDDSWFLDLDVARCPEIWPQTEISPGPWPDNDLHGEILDCSPPRDLEIWRNGGLVKTQKMPAYATFDIKEALATAEKFLDQCQPRLEAYILKSVEDEIWRLTVAEAHRYPELHDEETIRRAVKIRIELRSSELDISIIDDEKNVYIMVNDRCKDS